MYSEDYLDIDDSLSSRVKIRNIMLTNDRLINLASALVEEVTKPGNSILPLLKGSDSYTEPTGVLNKLLNSRLYTKLTGYRPKEQVQLWDNLSTVCNSVFLRPEFDLTSNPNLDKSNLDGYIIILNDILYGIEHYSVNDSSYTKLVEHHNTVYRGYPVIFPGSFPKEFRPYLLKALEGKPGLSNPLARERLATLLADQTLQHLHKIGILDPVMYDDDVQGLAYSLKRDIFGTAEKVINRALVQATHYKESCND